MEPLPGMGGTGLGARQSWLWTLWTALLWISRVTAADPNFAARFNLTDPGSEFNHLSLDGTTGEVYVGATNRLFHLDANLNLRTEVPTGPDLDSPACAPNPTSTSCEAGDGQSYNKEMMDNTNKVLLIDRENLQLVTCGSLFQGTCSLRPLNNIAMATPYRMDTSYYVAANDRDSSTVAFAAPGPQQYDVMYIATTMTTGEGGNELRDGVPAVSSRHLRGEKVLQIDYDQHSLRQTGSIQRISTLHRQTFLVTYVFGFAANGSSYFLSNQRIKANDQENNFISKIIQVCQGDRNYNSYLEIELRCNVSGAGGEYKLVRTASVGAAGSDLAGDLGLAVNDQVLVATFSDGLSPEQPGAKSALCVYSLQDIRRQMKLNYEKCFRGEKSDEGDHLKGFKQCVKREVDIPDNYCGNHSEREVTNSPLPGKLPLEAIAVRIFDTPVTAVALSTVGDHTIAFLGTAQGHMLKVLLSGDNDVYEDVMIQEDSAINPDLKFTKDGRYLLLMTQRSIYKMPVSECDGQDTCGGCTNMKDPYCGWCSLEKKCSLRSECRNYKEDQRWLVDSTWDHCIAIQKILPQEASISRLHNVTIKTVSLPVNQRYMCLFGDIEVGAKKSGSDVTCQTPPGNELPSFLPNSDHLNMTLSLKSVQTGISFLQTNFVFYDCGRHDACSKCTRSNWGCRWCIHDNVCVDDVTQCSTEVTSTDSDMCPILLALTEDINLPVNYSTPITLSGRNLPIPQASQKSYFCLFHITDPPIRVAATRRSSEEVECNPRIYNYDRPAETDVGTIDVVWGDDYAVEVETGIVATAYKCSVMGEDCSRCLSETNSSQKYNCEWCDNSCKFQPTCGGSLVTECPKPVIQEVTPQSSPLYGGTLVTISGSNLGKHVDEVDYVMVAGVDCPIVRDKYTVSTQIICETASVMSRKNGSIQVKIKTLQVPYEMDFRYQDPSVVAMVPARGPKAGGTLVTLTGTELNTGNTIRVLFGDVECEIVSKTSTAITCRTGPVTNPTFDYLQVNFDQFPLNFDEEKFEFNYMENPNISSISPRKMFLSGGRNITVSGGNFNGIQTPLFYVTNGNYNSNKTVCIVGNNSQMICPAPPVDPNATKSRLRRQAARVNDLTMAFSMDNVDCVQSLPDCYPDMDSSVLVYDDPVYTPFADVNLLQVGRTLTLNGKRLNYACGKEDVKVSIGRELCLVESINDDKLLCTVPEVQPKPVGSGELPEVEVVVGNLRQKLGFLKYEVKPDQGIWIIIVAVGGGVLITVIIIVVVIYKRRSADVERQNKKLQIQLDTLESNVRNECKQAFAELQTEVSDFTSDLNVIGIPFWDYKMYTFKVLFPGLKDHPVLHHNADISTNKFGGYEQGLQHFNQLLNSKQFLLIFIRTLEQQKNFSIRDKAVVASLLMIALQDKMEYATEILKALLNELIDRSVEKKHPKLMLRRTESVVEKLLSNWLSLSMYTYLRKHAGKMFFMLFKAIKHQTEKGPIDVFTAEARYSLSEDRLLREKIEPKTLTLLLLTADSKEPITCKVLDCDTVTQAKEKALDTIYLNTPFCRRPSVYDVELEWRTGRSGHLPLQDEDVTTQTENGWKRVNTLAHYHVADGATMALTQSKGNELVRQVHGRIEIGSSMSSLPPIITMEEGTKVWHLVKHDDSQNVQRSQKVISEIFLTRLLATKGTLQQYVDDMLMTILRVDPAMPPAIKFLFDFLDNAARRHNIVDCDVVHTWKSNSLPLRFWVNIIKNPEFVFDIHKSNVVDSCLSVIAQTLMDSCSTAEHRLGKDSPSNKLLFAKDIPKYRGWVSRYYKSVQDMPPISDKEMTRIMTEMSMTNLTDFNVSVALKELYKYAMQYNFELLEALDDDPSAKRLHLSNRFEQVQAIMEGSPLY